MEDNKNLENTQQNEEQQTDQEQMQEKKTFTQEEVDEIVRKRLARERRKLEADQGISEQTDREKELESRELKLMAKEKLLDAGMPLNLADILKYSDEKTLESAIETIKNLDKEAPKGWGQRHGHSAAKGDPIKKAMGLDR